MNELDYWYSVSKSLEKIASILEKNNEVKTEFANSVEISNANAKGSKQVTVKGKSDKPLSELVEEVNKQFKEAL